MDKKIKEAVQLLTTTADALLAVAVALGAVYELCKLLLPQKNENEA